MINDNDEMEEDEGENEQPPERKLHELQEFIYNLDNYLFYEYWKSRQVHFVDTINQNLRDGRGMGRLSDYMSVQEFNELCDDLAQYAIVRRWRTTGWTIAELRFAMEMTGLREDSTIAEIITAVFNMFYPGCYGNALRIGIHRAFMTPHLGSR